MAFRVLLFTTLALPFLLLFLLQVPYYEAVAVGGAGKVIPPPKVGNGPIDCAGLCRVRCSKHSRPNVCIRACGTCCFRCKCVPPGTYETSLISWKRWSPGPGAAVLRARAASLGLWFRISDSTIMAEEKEIPAGMKDEIAEFAPFDPSKNKKKKKVVIQDSAEEADKLAEKTENLSVADAPEPNFVGMKKKKKKPVETEVISDEQGMLEKSLMVGNAFYEGYIFVSDHNGEDEEGEGIVLGGVRYPWEGTDRDYLYEELLDRVFNILRENNPDLAGDRRRTVMRPPQVLREGTKKTVFVNFMDLCKTMHRQPEHVMTFLLAEMGTSGSLDGQQRLVVKGRFAPKNFEGILRRYVNEYVICNGCKSPDTILSKENRLFFLRCEQCGSHRSVAPIKAGFVARVSRHKAGT
ncbi:hypothetical protein J5N97_026521 [Dioscorea zingiberensis]|uniref:Eukaryotic translation initiation factor 2 subunit beta n=1 Tax=Dioscorea zingiberensis TaxID=325984 RepID=A0A9D5C3D8_9LILI|nr:hypothetical protein J5N97_026521 [Dioscorea zingiberensis]